MTDATVKPHAFASPRAGVPESALSPTGAGNGDGSLRSLPSFSHAVVMILFFVLMFAKAEEGFWPFDMVPKERIERRYEFKPSDEWLLKAQRGSLRLTNGGSGAFISQHGLVITNRHVAGTTLHRLSVPGKTDLIRDGFLAKTQAEEAQAPGLRFEQLVEVVNLNEKVRSTAKQFNVDDDSAFRLIVSGDEVGKERREHFKIEAIRLYPDGEYRLYKYKVYDDVRLVFAADLSSGYFGGDEDNFTYPRYDFDVAIFRAYENGKPAATPDYFPWSMSGAKENELIFFAGNPGETSRSITQAQLEMERDKILPVEIALYAREAAALQRYGAHGPDQFQFVQDRANHSENALKRLRGQLDGLRNPAMMARKKAEVDAAERSIADPENATIYHDAVAEMRGAVDRVRNVEVERKVLNNVWGLFSAQLVGAMSVVAGEQSGRNNWDFAERRQRYYEKQFLYDPKDMQASERGHLQETLEFLVSQLGTADKLTQLVLEGKTPADRAAELVAGTRIGRPDFYLSARASGLSEDVRAHDPMLALARKIFTFGRELNSRYQQEFGDVEKKCYAQIARALGRTAASRRAPDGNFSLRLSFGMIRGYDDQGRNLRPFTCFDRMYALSDQTGNRGAYHLNELWLKGRSTIDLCTPYNFVVDADGYGGNSGSAVFNRNRELVGILFDGNYPGLVGKFIYDEATKRSICVDSRAIVEVLLKIYGAEELVKEFVR